MYVIMTYCSHYYEYMNPTSFIFMFMYWHFLSINMLHLIFQMPISYTILSYTHCKYRYKILWRWVKILVYKDADFFIVSCPLNSKSSTRIILSSEEFKRWMVIKPVKRPKLHSLCQSISCDVPMIHRLHTVLWPFFTP